MTDDTQPADGSQADPGLAPPQHLLDADNAAVAGAVADINAAARKSGVELALEVSAIVLRRFFGGDYAAFTDVDRLKKHSYRRLATHPGLEMSPSTLQRLVRIGHQAATMPTAMAESLSSRHHRALLTLGDDAQREAMAAQALRLDIGQARGGGAGATATEQRRAQAPPAVRWTRAIGRALAQTKADGLRVKDLTKLPQAAFDEVEAALLEGERVLLALRSAVAEARAKRTPPE